MRLLGASERLYAPGLIFMRSCGAILNIFEVVSKYFYFSGEEHMVISDRNAS